MARYTNTRAPRRASASDTFVNVLLIGVLAVVGWLAWPSLVAQFYARTAGAPGLAQPTPASSSAPRPTPLPYHPMPDQPAIAPADAIADYNATAEAQYQQALSPQAAPVPNVDTTGDTAPLQYASKPAPDRQPAGDTVPTAEPITEAESNDQFGSKPAAPINIQQTQSCLHGQVWTESGCHRPTPVGQP